MMQKTRLSAEDVPLNQSSCDVPSPARRKGLLFLRGRAESLCHPGHRCADSAGKSPAGGLDAGSFLGVVLGQEELIGVGFGWFDL